MNRNPDAESIRKGIGFAGILGIISVAVWLLVDGAEIAFFVVMAVLSSAPFILYMMFMKTRIGTVLTGTVLLVATSGIYANVLMSDSSTAAFGFFVSPMLNFLIVTVGGALDSLLRKRGSHPPTA